MTQKWLEPLKFESFGVGSGKPGYLSEFFLIIVLNCLGNQCGFFQQKTGAITHFQKNHVIIVHIHTYVEDFLKSNKEYE